MHIVSSCPKAAAWILFPIVCRSHVAVPSVEQSSTTIISFSTCGIALTTRFSITGSEITSLKTGTTTDNFNGSIRPLERAPEREFARC